MSEGSVVKLRSLVVVCACWAVFGTSEVDGQAETPRSLLSGVYTEQQALQGQALYYEHCLQCHGETMAGADKAPALTGPQFASTWSGAPLVALVARILTMPPEKPGSLTQQQAVDVLTYMLWYNGLPLGAEPLAAAPEVLSEITFQTSPPQ